MKKGSALGSHHRPFAKSEDRKRAAGTAGRPIGLLANHFGMTLSRKEPVYHYDVKMFVKPAAGPRAGQAAGGRKPPPPDKPLRKSETELAMKAIQQIDKNNRDVSIIQCYMHDAERCK